MCGGSPGNGRYIPDRSGGTGCNDDGATLQRQQRRPQPAFLSLLPLFLSLSLPASLSFSPISLSFSLASPQRLPAMRAASRVAVSGTPPAATLTLIYSRDIRARFSASFCYLPRRKSWPGISLTTDRNVSPVLEMNTTGGKTR